MKIIVLGGNGFIAKNFIIENYLKKTDQIISIDKISIQQNFTKINNKKFIFYKLDLSKKVYYIFLKSINQILL